MIDIGKGIIAGLVASAVVAGVVLLASMAGLSSSPNPVHALSGIMLSPAGLSWVVHFALGTFVWGPLFSLTTPILPGPFWLKGAIFGAGAWLLMLLTVWAVETTVLPQVTPIPLALHLFFGILLGWIYAALLPATGASSRD